MLFAPDTEQALTFDVAVINTVEGATRSGRDELTHREQLAQLMKEYRFTGRLDGDDSELKAVRDGRSVLRKLWTLDRDAMVVEVNDLLARLGVAPRLERHDDLDWHLHATPDDAPLADRILVEAGMALVDVIRSGASDRLRLCAADDCVGMLVDLSRNGSKRFCSVRCSNRTNIIAFRQRRIVESDDTAGR